MDANLVAAAERKGVMISNKPHCIVVSGLAHTGSRLVVEMLNTHADIDVPMNDLFGPAEYRALHRFFIDAVDKTPLHAKEYAIDKDELFFILDSYLQNVNPESPYTAIKLPHYPLWCLDLFHEYFDGRISLLCVCRDLAKIKASYQRRGEDAMLFQDDAVEVFRQIKKLPVPARKTFMSGIKDFDLFLETLDTDVSAWIQRWREMWPGMAYATFDADAIATDPVTNWGKVLSDLNLSQEGIKQAAALVDTDRLANKRRGKDGIRKIKGSIRAVGRAILRD